MSAATGQRFGCWRVRGVADKGSTGDETVRLACGNVKVNGVLQPAAVVKGNESPLKTNSEVLTVAKEMATLRWR